MSVTGSDATTDPDGSSSTEGQDPASAAAPPSRRAALLRSGFIVGVLFVVFVVIIPRFVDYSEVAAAFRELTLPQVVFMTVLGAIAWFISGQLFTVLTEGLSVIQGGTSYLILSGIGSSVPFGPWNMGVVWVVVRGWGVGVQPATSGIALYGVINQLGRLALPLVAVIVLIATGGLGGGGGTAFVITHHQHRRIRRRHRPDRRRRPLRSCRRLARPDRSAGRVVGPRPVSAGPAPRTCPHRSTTSATSSARSSSGAAWRPCIVSIIAQLGWCVVLIAALRVVGVPENVAVTERHPRRLRPGERDHDHPDLAGRRGCPRAAVHRRPVGDRRQPVRVGDHGRRLPLPPVPAGSCRSRSPGSSSRSPVAVGRCCRRPSELRAYARGDRPVMEPSRRRTRSRTSGALEAACRPGRSPSVREPSTVRGSSAVGGLCSSSSAGRPPVLAPLGLGLFVAALAAPLFGGWRRAGCRLRSP